MTWQIQSQFLFSTIIITIYIFNSSIGNCSHILIQTDTVNIHIAHIVHMYTKIHIDIHILCVCVCLCEGGCGG